jgi:hypothetical protein
MVEDAINKKRDFVVTDGFAALAEFMIGLTLMEQLFNHAPWTLHRVTTLFSLSCAAVVVPMYWFRMRVIFRKLASQIFPEEAAWHTSVPTLRHRMVANQTLSFIVLFIVVMAFRSALDR